MHSLSKPASSKTTIREQRSSSSRSAYTNSIKPPLQTEVYSTATSISLSSSPTGSPKPMGPAHSKISTPGTSASTSTTGPTDGPARSCSLWFLMATSFPCRGTTAPNVSSIAPISSTIPRTRLRFVGSSSVISLLPLRGKNLNKPHASSPISQPIATERSSPPSPMATTLFTISPYSFGAVGLSSLTQQAVRVSPYQRSFSHSSSTGGSSATRSSAIQNRHSLIQPNRAISSSQAKSRSWSIGSASPLDPAAKPPLLQAKSPSRPFPWHTAHSLSRCPSSGHSPWEEARAKKNSHGNS